MPYLALSALLLMFLAEDGDRNMHRLPSQSRPVKPINFYKLRTSGHNSFSPSAMTDLQMPSSTQLREVYICSQYSLDLMTVISNVGNDLR